MKLTQEGTLLLFEAIMEQAYKDAESDNKKLSEEAKQYIENMKKAFS